MKPKIFIGSSVEGLNVAYAIQQNLTHNAESTVWDQGVFDLSKTTIESLYKIVTSVDFAIFVFSPDDEIAIRGKSSTTVRDNVLFELGLFYGRLGRERVFFIVPKGTDMHIPSDLIGVTSGHYDPNRQDKSFQAATGSVCNQIRNQVSSLGPLDANKDESISGESTDEHIDNKIEWLKDLIKRDYASAKKKLEQEIKTKEGEELLEDTAWLKYILFKLGQKNSLSELCAYASDNDDNLNILTLVPRFLLWEDYHYKAIEIIELALEKHPSDNDLIALKAQAYFTNDDDDKAIEILTSSSPSDNPTIAITLAEIHEELKNTDSALKVIDEAYKEHPNNELIMYKYARLLDESDRHKEAVYLLNSLTKSYPNSSTYWAYLSNSCLELDLYDKAMSTLRKAEELSEGKEAWILHNIGNLLRNKGFYSEAIGWLNKGLSINKDSEYAHDRLSSALKDKEKEQEKFLSACKEGRRLIHAKPASETEAETEEA